MKRITRCFVPAAICVLIAVSSFVVIKTVAAASDGSQEPRRVSIIALIVSPPQYDGVRVSVTGYLNLSYESNAVYFHEEDFRYGMTKNAIRVTLRRGQAEQFKALSGGYAIIEGTFIADESPTGMFSGRIADVTRMQKLQTEEEFLRSEPNSAKPGSQPTK
jgi:hypothetical protein